MNQNFSTLLRNIAFYILLPLGIAKVLWSIGLFFLDKDAIAEAKNADFHYHYNINLAQQIIKSDAAVAATQPVETHERIKDIKLKGTFNSGNESFIVLEDQLGSTFLYKGEKYVGYKLLEIYDERAVLEKGGVNYELIMEDEENKGGGSDATAPTAEGATEASTFVPGQPTKLTRDELNSYIEDPNKIWKNIRIQELRRNGELDGFRVNYVKKNSFFENAGLKSGDVITAIDGKELRSLADVMEYYTNVDSLEALSLRVKRGDQEVDLEFNVN